MGKVIRVLVVDDSAVMRELLTEILNSDPDIEVVGSASDPYVAREKIKALNPDVLTLDVEMPRMDGLMFLSNLMRLRPMPVVMCASVTERGADLILNALDLGAVDFISKPTARSSFGIRDAAQEIIAKVKVAATAHLRTAIEVPKKHTGEASAVVADPRRRTPQRSRGERALGPHRDPSALPFRRLARREVDLDTGSARVEEKQLPDPGRVTVLGQSPQVVFDSMRLELGHIGRRVGSEKGDMVEYAAAFWNRRSLHDMQHRLAVIIEPRAGEGERRARPRRKAENVVIEGDRLFGVRGQDGEMIHPIDRHRPLLPRAHKPRAASSAGG